MRKRSMILVVFLIGMLSLPAQAFAQERGPGDRPFEPGRTLMSVTELSLGNDSTYAIRQSQRRSVTLVVSASFAAGLMHMQCTRGRCQGQGGDAAALEVQFSDLQFELQITDASESSNGRSGVAAGTVAGVIRIESGDGVEVIRLRGNVVARISAEDALTSELRSPINFDEIVIDGRVFGSPASPIIIHGTNIAIDHVGAG